MPFEVYRGEPPLSGSKSYNKLQRGDVVVHLQLFGLQPLQQPELCFGALPVVLGVFDLVVVVAVEVIGQEAYGLHVGQQQRSVREQLPFDRREKGCSAFDVPFGKGTEDVHVDIDPVQIGIVLGSCICRCADEVTEVGEHESGHRCIQIDDAQRAILFVEENVVDLGVAVGYAFGKLPFAVKPLCGAHLVGTGQQLVDHPLSLFESVRRVLGNGFAEGLEPCFHVVEISNGFAEGSFADVRKHLLELSRSLSGEVGQGGGDGFVGNRSGDEQHYPPVVLSIEIEQFARFGRNHTQYPTVNIGTAAIRQFLPDVRGDAIDVALQQFDILKYMVVDPLQDIVGRRAFGGYTVGVVDPSITYRCDLCDGSLYVEVIYDLSDLFHVGLMFLSNAFAVAGFIIGSELFCLLGLGNCMGKSVDPIPCPACEIGNPDRHAVMFYRCFGQFGQGGPFGGIVHILIER